MTIPKIVKIIFYKALQIIAYFFIYGLIYQAIAKGFSHILGIIYADGPDKAEHVGFIIGFCGSIYIIIKLLLKFTKFCSKKLFYINEENHISKGKFLFSTNTILSNWVYIACQR